MPDPAIGALSTVVIDYENPAGWNGIKTGGVNAVSTSGGSAYTNGWQPVSFSGGTPTRVAVAYGNVVAGVPASIIVTDAGAGYASAPTATLPGGSGATITPSLGVVNARQIAVLSSTMVPAQELLPNQSLRGDFNMLDPAFGKKSASGQLVVIPNQQLVQFFLKSIVGGGAQTVVTGAGPYTHTNKLGNLTPISFILENFFNIGGTYKYQRAVGCRINQLTIPIDSTGLTPWTMDVLAADVQANAAAYAAAPTDWRSLGTPLDYTQLAAADVTIGGSAVAYIQKGSLSFNFNLGPDDYRVGGSATRGSLVPQGPAQITGNLTLVLDSTGPLTLITAGTASSITLKWTIGAHSILLALDRLWVQKTGPAVKDGSAVEVDVQVRAVYDATNTTSFRSVVINDQTGPTYI